MSVSASHCDAVSAINRSKRARSGAIISPIASFHSAHLRANRRSLPASFTTAIAGLRLIPALNWIDTDWLRRGSAEWARMDRIGLKLLAVVFRGLDLPGD